MTSDLLFMKEGNEYYFYQNDHLGAPQKMTGINGNVVWIGVKVFCLTIWILLFCKTCPGLYVLNTLVPVIM